MSLWNKLKHAHSQRVESLFYVGVNIFDRQTDRYDIVLNMGVDKIFSVHYNITVAIKKILLNSVLMCSI
jgi:methylmalonyl-CoA mutase cobalamin-binding subunit